MFGNSYIFWLLLLLMTCGVISLTTGSCKVTEFLLSKGILVNKDYGHGTPLHDDATNEQDKTEDFVGLP